MPPNRALSCSLHDPPSHFLCEELDWAARVYLTYSTCCTVPQFTPLKKFQVWIEERSGSAVMESHKDRKADYSFTAQLLGTVSYN